jgi:hypothetical protein
LSKFGRGWSTGDGAAALIQHAADASQGIIQPSGK